MRLFRRKRGRHALGAAVTSIPSGPLVVPEAVSAATAVPLPTQHTDAPAPTGPMSFVAPEVTSLPSEWSAAQELAPATVSDTASGSCVRSASAVVTSIDIGSVPDDRTHGGAPRCPSWFERDLLQATVVDAPGASPAAPNSRPAPGRVQLGFRDGTSTVLDFSSAQAQALAELAQSLTRGD